MKVNNINQNKLISSNKNVQNKQQAFGGKGIVTDAVFKAGVKVAPLGMIPEPLHFVNIAAAKAVIAGQNLKNEAGYQIQRFFVAITEIMH